jgi:GT2 family glycosyltransferase
MEYHEPGQVQAMGGGWLDRSTTATRHIGEGQPLRDLPADGSAVESRMAYVIAASMLVTREFVAAVGPMQEDYFLYFEEIDWALRSAGRFRLGYAPRSVVFHKMGGSSSRVASAFSLNLLYRNRLRFVSRFLPERLAATRRVLAMECLRHLLKGRWVAARLVAGALRDSRSLAASAPAAQLRR